ncbi:MAG: endonuclease/exonuclease/phosphatase family protein [Pseudomonadota bacterium]
MRLTYEFKEGKNAVMNARTEAQDGHYFGQLLARLLRGGVVVLAGLAALALAGSYLGALHPVGDSLAVFRDWIGFGALGAAGLMLLARMRWPLAVLLGLWGGLAWYFATPVGTPLAASEFREPQRIYQKNLLFALEDPSAILADIAARDPQFITLQEVSARNAASVLDALPRRYARHFCPYAAVGGVAVLSTYDVIEGSRFCLEGQGIVGFQVDAPGGPLWVISVHMHWPYPFDQPQQLAALIPVIEALEGPVLIGGDFNMVAWSHALRSYERASGGEVAAPLQGTFPLLGGWLFPAIDHVILPQGRGGGLEALAPRNGSDHYTVIGVFEGAP